MTDDTWRIIPKKHGRLLPDKLILRWGKRKDGARSCTLLIPLRIRQASDYFKDPKLAYCNLLEKGSLVMVQFIPENKKEGYSRRIYSSGLQLPPDRFEPYLAGKHLVEVPHKIEKGNIIIDREVLKDAKELKDSPCHEK